MDDKTKRKIEKEVVENDQEWEAYLRRLTAEGYGLTVEQLNVFESLDGEKAREYLDKHSMNKD